jgi:hypothetical protein
MKRIHFPLRNIVLNIFTDTVQLEIIPDDMFPIITLPDDKNVCVVSKPFGDTAFETPNNGSNRFWDNVLVFVVAKGIL